MASPLTTELHELASEEQAPAEQILANALELYAAIPSVARAATLRALRATAPEAHGDLAQEVSRAILAFRLQQRRAAAVRRIERRSAAGTSEEAIVSTPPAPLTLEEDAALGAEAVRLVKESRERRAGTPRRPS